MTVAARYIAIEAAVSAAINAVLSIAFTLAVFGGTRLVPASDLAFDAIPQTFMVALMATLVPTVLTQKRLKTGRVARMTHLSLGLPRSVVGRSLLVALLLAAFAWAAHQGLLPMDASFAFASVLMVKTLYGALLGAMVTAFAVRVALGEA